MKRGGSTCLEAGRCYTKTSPGRRSVTHPPARHMSGDSTLSICVTSVLFSMPAIVRVNCGLMTAIAILRRPRTPPYARPDMRQFIRHIAAAPKSEQRNHS